MSVQETASNPPRPTYAHFEGAKVLVTGATGFTGARLTRKLVEVGARVSAIAREASQLEELADLDIDWHRGDVFDPEIASAGTADCQYIFHLAAAFREEMANDDAYRPVHLHSTQLLAKAVAGNPAFKRFVHISTVGVHGHIEAERADETYSFNPGDGYQRTKLEGELWLDEFATRNQIPYTIVRPTPIFGPGDRRLLKFFRMVNKGYLPMLGGRRGVYHLIHVDDLVEILLLAAVSDAALSNVFIAANDDPVAIEEMGRIVAEALGRKVRIVRLPIKPFFWAADMCKAVCAPLGIQPPLYRRRVAFYTKDRKFDTSKLRNVLGYHPAYDNETGLAETARWYASRGWL